MTVDRNFFAKLCLPRRHLPTHSSSDHVFATIEEGYGCSAVLEVEVSIRSLLVCLFALATATPAFAGSSPLYGNWVLEELRDGVVTPGVRTTLEVEPGGRAGGSGGCNSYGGGVTVTDNALKFTDIAWTEMACEPATMAQEAGFLAALAAAVKFHAEAGILVLIDSAGSKLAMLRAL